jgi:hypothetical protein
MCEFASSQRFALDESKLKKKAFRFRKNLDGYFNNDLIIPTPKKTFSGFNGISCMMKPSSFTKQPFLMSFDIATVTNLSPSDFSAKMQNLKIIQPGHTAPNRVGVVWKLREGVLIPNNRWIVDHDDAGMMDHVTIAVSEKSGIPAIEDGDDGNKFTVPEIEEWNWQFGTCLYVFEGSASWRDDYFPDAEGWNHSVRSFDLVMKYGTFDDFLDIWRVHGLLHSDKVGRNIDEATKDILAPLLLARQTLFSHLYSGECDPNESQSEIYRGIDFLDFSIAKAKDICVKSLFKPVHRAPALLTNVDGDIADPKDLDFEMLNFITEECKKMNITPVFGSAFALTAHPGVGPQSVKFENNREMFRLTWNADDFCPCIIDEISEGVNGFVQLKIEDHEVKAVAAAVDDLLEELVVDEQRIKESMRCCGFTIGRVQCGNKTLTEYTIGDSPWTPLCWRHKQQVLSLHHSHIGK